MGKIDPGNVYVSAIRGPAGPTCRVGVNERLSKIVIVKIIQSVEIVFGAVVLHLAFEAASNGTQLHQATVRWS